MAANTANKRMRQAGGKWMLWPVVVLAAAVLLAGCGGGSSSSSSDPEITPYGPTLGLSFPDSLTGGASAEQSSLALGPLMQNAAQSDGPHCNFKGHGGGDPFRNGHRMTKFLVGTVATWVCFSDFLMNIVSSLIFFGILTPDGTILAIEPDPSDPDAPTGISVTIDSATQKTVLLYWDSPAGSVGPSLFYSWDETGATITGRLIVDLSAIDGSDPEAPVWMRMDLDFGATTKAADMFIAFDSGNAWAEAFRIQVSKMLDGSLPVFTAKGMMQMRGQWFAEIDPNINTYISVDPAFNIYTISDGVGVGAAIALMSDVGIGFDFGDGDHAGYYLFDKVDKYFFTKFQGWEWIEKSVSGATYEGGRVDTVDLPGKLAWIESLDDGPPFNNSLMPLNYFTSGNDCFDTSTFNDCTGLFEFIFQNADFGGMEQNVGSDPGDWRNPLISSPAYLNDPCPDNIGPCTWDGQPGNVFEMIFTP